MPATVQRHKWVKQDSTGRSKTCDRCALRVDRFGVGRTSYYAWSWSATNKGDTQDGSTVPPCPGYPGSDTAIVHIPTTVDLNADSEHDQQNPDDDGMCEGHESLNGPIGNVEYCDGTCRP